MSGKDARLDMVQRMRVEGIRRRIGILIGVCYLLLSFSIAWTL
jgi:hypothetical protein